MQAGQGRICSGKSEETSLTRAEDWGAGTRRRERGCSGPVQEGAGFPCVSELLPQPRPFGAGGLEWCLWNFLISSLGHVAASHLLPSGASGTIRNPGSSTHLEGLDITTAHARTNRAWHRAARSYPRANTALCQMGNRVLQGQCVCWVGGRQVPPSPWTILPTQALTSVLTSPALSRGGGGRGDSHSHSRKMQKLCKKQRRMSNLPEACQRGQHFKIVSLDPEGPCKAAWGEEGWEN